MASIGHSAREALSFPGGPGPLTPLEDARRGRHIRYVDCDHVAPRRSDADVSPTRSRDRPIGLYGSRERHRRDDTRPVTRPGIRRRWFRLPIATRLLIDPLFRHRCADRQDTRVRVLRPPTATDDRSHRCDERVRTGTARVDRRSRRLLGRRRDGTAIRPSLVEGCSSTEIRSDLSSSLPLGRPSTVRRCRVGAPIEQGYSTTGIRGFRR